MKFFVLFLVVTDFSSHFGCAFVERPCKDSRDCFSDESCGAGTWKLCECREGFVRGSRRPGECLQIRSVGQTCQYDVQCHQNKKLGLICHQYSCACPNQLLPSKGRCPAVFSQVGIHSEKDGFMNSRFFARILVASGLGIGFAMAVAVAIIFFKTVRHIKKSGEPPAPTEGESTAILHDNSSCEQRSRPPSYSSLPPSYDDIAPSVASFWRSWGRSSDRKASSFELSRKKSATPELARSSEEVVEGAFAVTSPSAPLFSDVEEDSMPPN